MSPPRLLSRSPAALGLVTALLAGCAAGPDYVRPALTPPAEFKEAGGPWKTASPQPADANRPWWERYGDPLLNDLVGQANRQSLNIKIAEAQYRQARAAVQYARSGYFPTLGANVSGGRGRSISNGQNVLSNSHSVGLDASWEPDLWGQVRRSVEAGADTAQASAADLAGARLSIQAELVQDYLQLRIADADKDLLTRTVDSYRKALALTRSQYGAGVATRADVALAETQLKSAQAQAIDVGVTRSQLEHAIAILVGQAPSEFSIAVSAKGAETLKLPVVPTGLPSELLERRPDIAGAERRAAAANADIGVAQSAYFPALTLGATLGYTSANFAQWFSAPARIWSLGATLAGTIFDGGARAAKTDEARAAFDAAAGTYKQTVLAGFQEVEDNLAALRILEEERAVEDEAVAAAQVAERASLAQYRAGTATYLAVVTAQTLALSNERSAVQLRGRQLVASAALVKALGGGWTSAELDAEPVAQAGPAQR
ncbi:MAG: efflux transporter outer membrane subunit [Proteobacteria bacterium]|nr:efflux transporter outer membrane subunit [Pseudomonadota bacterium]